MACRAAWQRGFGHFLWRPSVSSLSAHPRNRRGLAVGWVASCSCPLRLHVQSFSQSRSSEQVARCRGAHVLPPAPGLRVREPRTRRPGPPSRVSWLGGWSAPARTSPPLVRPHARGGARDRPASRGRETRRRWGVLRECARQGRHRPDRGVLPVRLSASPPPAPRPQVAGASRGGAEPAGLLEEHPPAR